MRVTYAHVLCKQDKFPCLWLIDPAGWETDSCPQAWDFFRFLFHSFGVFFFKFTTECEMQPLLLETAAQRGCAVQLCAPS